MPFASRSSLHDLRIPFDVCSHAKESSRHTASKLRISIVCQRDFRMRAVVKGQVYRGLTVHHCRTVTTSIVRGHGLSQSGVSSANTRAKIFVKVIFCRYSRSTFACELGRYGMDYDFQAIEKRWKAQWKETDAYRVIEDPSRPKYYVLDMFPYPSGAGLHVGHPLGYIASDVFARYKRHQGFNVLHPMGYDSFGLAGGTVRHPNWPASRRSPRKPTSARYREQLEQLGFCYDWSREVRTSDPAILPLDAVDFWRACSNLGMTRRLGQGSASLKELIAALGGVGIGTSWRPACDTKWWETLSAESVTQRMGRRVRKENSRPNSGWRALRTIQSHILMAIPAGVPGG